MLLKLADWVFDIDMTATMEYSAGEAKDHCLCAYCRNFYGGVDQKYPGLRPVLAQFGLDVEAPDELCPYFPPTDCTAYYAVAGKVLKWGSGPILVDGLKIFPQTPEEAMVNTYLTGEHFFLNTDMMKLDWVLDEPMEDVVSPANEPTFFRKIVDRVLGRIKDSVKN